MLVPVLVCSRSAVGITCLISDNPYHDTVYYTMKEVQISGTLTLCLKTPTILIKCDLRALDAASVRCKLIMVYSDGLTALKAVKLK